MRIGADLDSLRERGLWILVAVFVVVLLLGLRLGQLQVVESRHWSNLALNNRLRKIPLPALRGRIFDRNGQIFAENRPSFQLLVFPDEIRDTGRSLAFLSDLGIQDIAELRKDLRIRGPGAMAPLVAAETLSSEQVARIEAHQRSFPELSIVNRFMRFYPFGPLTAHLIGYLRHPRIEEVQADPDLEPSRLLGATGIEKLANATLTGVDGRRWVVASAVGRQLGVLREEQPRAGEDLSISLDLRIQEAAAEALKEHSGAIVAIDVHSGAIRALYSSPSYDPNVFSGALSPRQWAELSQDPRHPLQNRCTQGGYPPGSTIKPFLALAALEEGLVTPSWSVYCNGSTTLYGHVFRCWRRGGHGRVSMRRALESSCDVYFYLLGQKLGIEKMAGWLGFFGFGKAPGLGLGSEHPGLVGTPEWSRMVRKSPWYPGESVSVSIGQGPVLTNALQLARAFAILANGGVLIQPHLIEGGRDEAPEVLPLDPAHLKIVRDGLEAVVDGLHGTAHALQGLPVAGKTGTAQVVSLPKEGQELSAEQQHHAWFAGWIPRDRPEVAVAVLVEHGGGGGSVAAPAARVVFRRILSIIDEDRP